MPDIRNGDFLKNTVTATLRSYVLTQVYANISFFPYILVGRE